MRVFFAHLRRSQTRALRIIDDVCWQNESFLIVAKLVSEAAGTCAHFGPVHRSVHLIFHPLGHGCIVISWHMPFAHLKTAHHCMHLSDIYKPLRSVHTKGDTFNLCDIHMNNHLI